MFFVFFDSDSVISPVGMSAFRAMASTSSTIIDQTFAQKFLSFVDASPSPYHAVETSRERLVNAGFERLSEHDEWQLKKGGKYYFTRNSSTIVAFTVGEKYVAGNGFHMIGAHTDSPCLRLKPRTAAKAHGFHRLAVQTYGGGLWNTWFDRDLSVAGRLIYRNATTGSLEQFLLRVQQPILRVPSLAIHLRPPAEINNEDHVVPILATAVRDQLDDSAATATASSDDGKHYPSFLKLLASTLHEAHPSRDFDPAAIVDFELCLYDTQPSAIGGLHREFVFSPRLDNLMSSYCALEAIIGSTGLESESNVRVCMLFDNEEVGSVSYQGAASSLLDRLVSRVVSAFPDSESVHAQERSYANSFLISADMAHALHPNYPEKHERLHGPVLHKGPVIKHNCNLRYATNAHTAAIVRTIASNHSIPLQDFVVRQDGPCGSTIGPMLSAKGVRVLDIGNPQLSMHSIREMCGTDDVCHAVRLFTAFYEEFASLDQASRFE